MPDEDELGIMEEFEWALKDPTEEKIRQLGEVVSTITTKLVAAISEIQETVYKLQNEVSNLNSKMEQLEGKISRISTAGPAAASAPSAASAASDTPIAAAPKPKPSSAPPPSPRGGLMGELKAALAARRRKAGGDEG